MLKTGLDEYLMISYRQNKLQVLSISNIIAPWWSWGICSRPPVDTKIWGFSCPLYKMAQYLHMTCVHPPIDFKASLICL